MPKPVILSGIKPTGELHIGNLIGALRQWVILQEEYMSYFCIVDLHAITLEHDPKILQKRTLEIAKLYLAVGINPRKSLIFIQSHISAHTELAWILNCVAKVGEMERMTQYKDAIAKGKSPTMGLFDYPVLMAADIFLYNADIVPVGADQKQHVELARNLAQRFNKKFGHTINIPKFHGPKLGARIMSLAKPTEKMSKSEFDPYGTIGILDNADVIRKKIKKAVTDSGNTIIFSDAKPALKNLITIYCALGNVSTKEVEQQFIGKGYKDFKEALSDVIINALNPIQEKYNSLSDEYVLKILHDGAKKAKMVAQKNLNRIKQKIGFIL